MRQEVTWNGPPVVHFHRDVLLIPCEPHTDWRARRAVSNGIGREVRDRLKHSMLIPGAHTVHVAIEGDLAVASDRLELVDDLSAHCPQIRRPWLDRDTLAFSFSREIQQVSDDALNAMHSAFDDVGVSLRECGRLGSVLNTSSGEQNRVERVTNVVTDDRENPLLEVSGQR